MEMPEAAVAAVASYLADDEIGRPWIPWDSRFSFPAPEDPETRYYDVRGWDEIKEMARFAATCKTAHQILEHELWYEKDSNKEDIYRMKWVAHFPSLTRNGKN